MPRKPRNQAATEKVEAASVPAEDGKAEDTAPTPQATPRRSSRQTTKADYSGRSRRSSTAAQTAASKAESRTSECNSPVESPATRVKSARRASGQGTRREMPHSRASSKNINYEESDGEEDNRDEDEYKLDDESENESNSGDGRRRRGSNAAASKTRSSPRTPPKGRGRGRPRGSTRSAKKDEESAEEEDEDAPSPPKRTRGATPAAGTGRRGRRAAAAPVQESPAPSRRSGRRGRKPAKEEEPEEVAEEQEDDRKRKASPDEDADERQDSKKAKVGKAEGENKKVEEEEMEEDAKDGEETKEESEKGEETKNEGATTKVAKEEENKHEEKMEVDEEKNEEVVEKAAETKQDAKPEPEAPKDTCPKDANPPTKDDASKTAPLPPPDKKEPVPPEPVSAPPAPQPPAQQPPAEPPKPAEPINVATVNGTETSSVSPPPKENGSTPDGPQYLCNPSVSQADRERLQGKAFQVVSLSVEGLMKGGAEGAAREKFLSEVKNLNADVLCLQGVTSEEQFGTQLQPGLDALGYKGVVSTSGGASGQATLARASRFVVQSHAGVSLQSLIAKDLEASPLEQADRDAVAAYLKPAGEAHILTTRLSAVADGPQKTLLVANCSLVPTDPSGLAIQTCCLARELCREPSQGRILAGQLHLQAGSAAHQLLRDGYLDDDMIEDLQRRKDVPLPGKENAALINLLWKAFQHTSSSLRSCYATVKGSELQGSSSLAWYSSDSLQVLGVLDPATSSALSPIKATLVFSD
uniref:Putative secretory protein n=1 Tax=Ornithodoros turicata TaxID=34597 RepID=A0A2R5L6P8_9ACAR